MPRQTNGFRFFAKKILTYPRCDLEKEEVPRQLKLKIKFGMDNKAQLSLDL